jgi:transcriptional regulator with XRE-family HTH domain
MKQGNGLRKQAANSIRREAAREKFAKKAYCLYAIYNWHIVAVLRYTQWVISQNSKIIQVYLAMDFIQFYERVKSLAKTNKTTIEYVAGEAGLSLASYNAYRRHQNLPRADEALKIAQTLGTTVEYLITGNNPEPVNSEKTLAEIQALLDDHWRKLRKPDKK